MGGVREHPGRAVAPPLLAFPDVVQERGGEEVGVVVAAFEEPERRMGRMDDVARVLGLEQFEQGRREVLAGDGEVRWRRRRTGVAELGDAVEDHTSSRNTLL
jgi:hypothetical protein